MRIRWKGCLSSLLGLCLLGTLVSSGLAGEVPRMKKEELKTLLGSSDVVIIDTRLAGSWEGSRGKIAGAVREDPRGVSSWAGQYDKDHTVVVYCS
jgi:hypothetical protein